LALTGILSQRVAFWHSERGEEAPAAEDCHAAFEPENRQGVRHGADPAVVSKEWGCFKRLNIMSRNSFTIVDCTLRDGGYYNAWNFSPELIADYLSAMKAGRVHLVELGFRFLDNKGFKGACAYATDAFLRSLPIPTDLSVGVMVNAADLRPDIGIANTLERLFPETASTTPVDLVRFACHYHELPGALSASRWLSDRGYRIGINLMQISDRTQQEIENLGAMAADWPVEVLYFADSMGGMTPQDVSRIVGWLRTNWSRDLGIHTHDNMGLGLSNTLRAAEEGVTWLDSTVTGMGRGPGNTRTEELLIEAERFTGQRPNLVPLMALIRQHFGPMKTHYGWGTNPYYFLAGKYGIHPTYIQEMLGDARYDEEDILAVIDHLRTEGGKKFSFNSLDGARQYYRGKPYGTWSPADVLEGREVLILGAGNGVSAHRSALEDFIKRRKPVVLALNTQSSIDQRLIDLRIACHPVRLLADADDHAALPQPLITPASMLPESLRAELGGKEIFDFGLGMDPGRFEFHQRYCLAPNLLVLSYALAAATAGKASKIMMAGFDGYAPGDARNDEMEAMLSAFAKSNAVIQPVSITPSRYKNLASCSVYAL
jgi:4-hydroxy 2-oxovalerate aldolase